MWRELDWPERLRYVGMMALVLGPTMASAVWLHRDAAAHIASGTVDWNGLAVRAGLVTLVWASVVAIAWRAGRWRSELKP